MLKEPVDDGEGTAATMDFSVANEEFAHVKHAFVKAQRGHACLPASAVLYELIQARGVACDLRRGFLINDHLRAALWHVWVDVGGEIYDIGSAITSRLTGYDIGGDRVTPTVPLGYERSDLDDADEERTAALNDEMYELYAAKPDDFWALAPREVKSIRKALLCRRRR